MLNRHDRQYMYKKPDRSRHVKKPDEENNQFRFKDALQYARGVTKDPLKKAYYTPFREKFKNSEYLMAIADAMKPPEILSVNLDQYSGQASQPILVHAYDYFGVVAIEISLQDPTGKILESGSASPSNKRNEWIYTSQANHLLSPGSCIQVSVLDKPGNKTKACCPVS